MTLVWAVYGTPEKVRLGTQIELTDRAIDRLVYELYDLTEEEIRVVVGSEDLSPNPFPGP